MSERVVLTAIKVVFYVTLIVAAVLVGRKVNSVLDNVNVTLGQLNVSASHIDSQLNAKSGLFEIVRATALHADRAVGEAAIASREQRIAAKMLDVELIGTVKHVNRVVDDAANDLGQVSVDVHDTLTKLGPVLDSTTKTLDSARSLLDNQDILSTLTNINKSTAEMNVTLQHVSGVTGNLEQMSADLSKSLHKTLNPSRKSLALGYGLTILKFGGALVPLF